MGFFASIISLAINKGKISETDYRFELEQYNGINNHQVPMRIYYSKKKTNKTAIMFLGASPDGEEHKSINYLAKILTKFNYNVFIPRIPPLMQLNISNKNVDWIKYLYELIQKRNDVDSKNITAIGISYGGGMLLKASLSKKMTKIPPKSIFLYGSGCNADTILKFITKGEFDSNGKLAKVMPHDWGLTVFFHHFIDEIDFGFDSKNIKEVIQYRINNNKEKAKERLEKLEANEYKIANSIITGRIIPEVQEMVDKLIIIKSDYIEQLSCKPICHLVKPKVFIFHGANDNMVPFTESIQLNQLIPDSSLLISYIFEHKGISNKRSILFKLKEILKLVHFLSRFDKHNAS
mgnify:FL=1|tara:strand:- start:1418 stop:2464 length:1047 start_codon:yes stop_codon:yes gene_type:complete